MTRLPLILSLLLVFTPINAFAVEINDAGAANLKTLVSELLADQKKNIEANGGSLITDGEITVEQAADYYAVTLPDLSFQEADGSKANFGIIAINATPTDSPDNWKMSVAMPTPITYSDKDGKPEMQIHIGNQRMGGLWNKDLNNFSTLAASYDDVKITHAEKRAIVTLGQINIKSDLKEDGDNKWSGPTKFSIENLEMGNPHKDDSLKIDNMLIDVAVAGYDPQTQAAAIEKIQNNPKESKSNILDLIKSSGSNIEVEMKLSGVNANIPNKKTKETNAFSLDSAYYSLGLVNKDDGKMNNVIKFGYNGLNNPKAKDDLIPTQMDFDLSLNNLPLSELIDTFSGAFTTGANPSAQKVAALQMMMTLPQMLSAAGTTLSMSDTKFGNSDYKVNMDANIKANPASQIGATGTMNTSIKGLDNIVKSLEAKKATAAPADLPKLEASIKRIQALRLVSDQDGDTNIYKITLTEDAKILVNGKDASSLLAAAQ